jgi:hypothetical protein
VTRMTVNWDPKMPLNEEQQLALDSVVDGHNVFITGGAGVGKSYLVSYIVENTKNIAVTAMTGCAALLIGGTTLHSHLAIGLAKDPATKLAMLARKYPGVRRVHCVDSVLRGKTFGTVLTCTHAGCGKNHEHGFTACRRGLDAQ